MKILKFTPERAVKEVVEIPDDWVVFPKSYGESFSMDSVVNCCVCGKEIMYGDSYESFIYTPMFLDVGLPICEECKDKEFKMSEKDYTIKDSGERTVFDSGAKRDCHKGKGRFDLLPMCTLMRLAKHFEAGADKYDARNWEKGIPSSRFLDSAFRHLVKYADGWTDEDHLIAAIWNLSCLAWNEEKRQDMMDIPSRINAPAYDPHE